MKVAFVVALCLIGASSASSDGVDYSPSARIQYGQNDPAIPNTNQDPDFLKFQKFVQEFSKTYRNMDEYKVRFQLFKRSLRRVEQHNGGGSSYKTGINQYSDRTGTEMEQMHGFAGHRGQNNH